MTLNVTLPTGGADPWGDTLDTAITTIVSYINSNEATWSAAGVTDHGALSGLSDDDHPQYALLASLGDASTLDVGTTAGTVAAGDHDHDGIYDPAGSAAAAQAAAIAASQPLDSDLTAIAALTTTAWGRALLELADAAAGRTALGLGSAATLSTADVDERARDALGSALVAGSGISITPNDGADTLVVAATASGGVAIHDSTSWPSAGTGNNGDYALVRSHLTEGTNAMFLVGPKASGAWPSTGYAISMGGVGKQAFRSTAPLSEGALLNNPTVFAAQSGTGLPNTSANGFEKVQGLSNDVNGVYGSATSTAVYPRVAAIEKKVGGFNYQPVASLAMARVTVQTLPAAGGYIGCGSGGSAPYTLLVDSLGKPYLFSNAYGAPTPYTTTPMAAGSNGDVVSGDILVWKREGVLFTGIVLNGSTGAVKRTLNAVSGGTGDQVGAQYFAFGAAPYITFNDTTGRLKDGWCMA